MKASLHPARVPRSWAFPSSLLEGSENQVSSMVYARDVPMNHLGSNPLAPQSSSAGRDIHDVIAKQFLGQQRSLFVEHVCAQRRDELAYRRRELGHRHRVDALQKLLQR